MYPPTMFARALHVVVFELLNDENIKAFGAVDAGSWPLWTREEGAALSKLGEHLVRHTDVLLHRMMPTPENRTELHVANLTGASPDGEDRLSRAGVFFHHVIRLMLATWTASDLGHAREVAGSKGRLWHPAWQLMTKDLDRCVALIAKTMRPARSSESAYREVGEGAAVPSDDDGDGERLPPAADNSSDDEGTTGGMQDFGVEGAASDGD